MTPKSDLQNKVKFLKVHVPSTLFPFPHIEETIF